MCMDIKLKKTKQAVCKNTYNIGHLKANTVFHLDLGVKVTQNSTSCDLIMHMHSFKLLCPTPGGVL